MADDSPSIVAFIGAGTMGAGIAQVAATSGWIVELKDVDDDVVRTAIANIASRLDRLIEKGRLTKSDRDDAVARLRIANDPVRLRDCDLIIEAIVEDLEVKARVLRDLVPLVRDDTIFATNTSSLSVTHLGEAIGQARRTAGMHFFNPAPVMKLVEVIAGRQTEAAVVDRVASIATAWGKTVARAADVPGFIVNHVARPYYLEALRILEEGLAGVDEIDQAMRSLGGFRMGPLELIDLIGLDINAAAARSVWEQLGRPPLLHPSALQEEIVARGDLGRKTGRGMYDYREDPPRPAVTIERRALTLSDTLRDAVGAFVRRATERRGSDLEEYVFARILVAIFAQAALALGRGVASKDDIDTAMRCGVNYPKGPFEWAEAIGPDVCARLLEALNATVTDDRFAVPGPLRRPSESASVER